LAEDFEPVEERCEDDGYHRETEQPGQVAGQVTCGEERHHREYTAFYQPKVHVAQAGQRTKYKQEEFVVRCFFFVRFIVFVVGMVRVSVMFAGKRRDARLAQAFVIYVHYTFGAKILAARAAVLNRVPFAVYRTSHKKHSSLYV